MLQKALVVVRTFSKSYGLAGMRVGFGLASAGVISMLDRVRDAYNVDRIAQVAAQAAFEDVEYFDVQRAKVIATREATLMQLDALGWFTYPSAANLLFTEPKNAAGASGAAVSPPKSTYASSTTKMPSIRCSTASIAESGNATPVGALGEVRKKTGALVATIASTSSSIERVNGTSIMPCPDIPATTGYSE